MEATPISIPPTSPQRLPFRQRIQHFTWAWFTTTMSTGGLAILLHETPHRFRGLTTIGLAVFLFDLALFVTICALICIRFRLAPGALAASLTHPTEALYFGSFWLSCASIICNIELYGVPSAGAWLIVVLRVLFWLYAAGAFLVAVLQYWHLFTGGRTTPPSSTPAWLLPIFPTMLAGTVAALLAGSQAPRDAGPILVGGATFQGLGFLVSLLVYGNYVGRLMASGLPEPDQRPGMFIAVGPPAFTAQALIGLASAAQAQLPGFYVGDNATVPTGEVLVIVATAAGILLWAVSGWFLSVAAGPPERFHLAWWSFVFPNIGFVLSTGAIGAMIHSEGVRWAASGLTVLVVVVYLFVGFCHARAVWRGKVLWPGRDEDKDA